MDNVETAEKRGGATGRSVAALKRLILTKAIEAGRAYEAYSESWKTYRQPYAPDAPLLPEVEAACKASNKAETELRALSRELARALAAVSK